MRSGARRLGVDAYVQFLAASAVGKITGEEVEEGLHLDVEGLGFWAMASISLRSGMK